MIQLLLAIGSGLALTATFPNWHADLLAWVALVPLLVAIHFASPAHSFLLGWTTGFVFFATLLPWLTHTMTTYSTLSPPLAVLILLAMAATLGGYVALFGWGQALLCRRLGPEALLVAPILWVALEWIRGHLFTGFPWGSLGYSQSSRLLLIQIAAWTGVYGVSFLLVLVNAGIALGLLLAWRGVRLAGPPVLIALVVTLSVGAWRLAETPAATFPVALVQGSIDQAIKWNPGFQRATMAIYKKHTQEAASSGARLIIWPETAVPYVLTREPTATAELRALAVAAGTPILVGALAAERRGGAEAYFNSAFLVTGPDGPMPRYDKMHLVPFGEYVPLRRLLFFVEAIASEIGDFTPGLRPVVFDKPQGRFGVVICYEGIFPELFREFVRGGAEFMVNITNDGWFGRTSGPIQHLSMIPFRAVENGVAVVRAANTGVSTVIEPSGRIGDRLGLFQRGHLVGRVPLRQRATFYTRFGDLFAWMCLAASVLLVAWSWKSRGSRSAR